MPSTDRQTDDAAFDRKTYVKMLIAVARADRENGLPEYRFVRKQARQLGVDFEKILSGG